MFPRGAELAEVEALGRRICEAAAHLEAAKARLLELVADFDRRQGALAEGCRSTAHWLNWRCGSSRGEARDQVRVARALGDRPLVAAAFGRGELSFAKARALCRAPSGAVDEELVALARASTTAQLEQVIRAWRRADTADDAGKADKDFLTYGHTEEGRLRGRFEVADELGSLLVKALEAGRDELRQRRR